MEDTEWFGAVSHIEISEHSNGLLIQSTPIRRKGHLAIGLLIAIGFSLVSALRGSWWGVFLSAVCGLFWIVAWAAGQRSALIRVNDKYLVGEGKKTVRLAWDEIHDLKYSSGGEDEPSGLYARVGRWKSICVMTNINREQTEEIVSAIYRRFPDLKMAEEIEPIGDRLRSWVEKLFEGGTKD